MDVVTGILLKASLLFLCSVSLVSVLLGAVMLLRPERIVAWGQYFSRWFGSAKISEQLDRPHWIDRYFYRHHRVVGAVLVIGAVYVLYTFLLNYNVRRISAAFASHTWGLLDALIGLMLIGGVLAALVGLIVLVSPSLLREIETSANRWVATDGMAKTLNEVRNSFDQFIQRHNKAAGALMIAGGLYVLIFLGPLLWLGGWKF